MAAFWAPRFGQVLAALIHCRRRPNDEPICFRRRRVICERSKPVTPGPTYPEFAWCNVAYCLEVLAAPFSAILRYSLLPWLRLCRKPCASMGEQRHAIQRSIKHAPLTSADDGDVAWAWPAWPCRASGRPWSRWARRFPCRPNPHAAAPAGRQRPSASGR